MKYLFSIILILLTFNCTASSKEEFLIAWEKHQKNNPEVESFEKISDKKYRIKFTTLPFEGELAVLAYDIEDLSHMGINENEFTLSGYVEIDLIGAPDTLMQKYARTYFKWAGSNALFYNSKTKEWVDSKQFADETQLKVDERGLLSWIAEYFDYFLAVLFLYIIYTLFFGNKNMKLSLAQQKQAMDDMEDTKKHMTDALLLHKETNKLLSEILEILKK